ncbi:MAG TPA: trypsin-like peptidase domain-containing protein [Burkholderiaceae bacterium]|nr:trypsin-like peptidase domain-containing protein [Burkholderiaceae bacterium]
MKLFSVRNPLIRGTLGVAMAAMLWAQGTSWAADGVVDKVEALSIPAREAKQETRAGFAVDTHTFVYRLPQASETERERGRSAAPRSGGDVPQIGFARQTGELKQAAYVAQHLNWTVQPNGDRVATLQVASPAAQGLRLALVFDKLDPRVRLAVSDKAQTHLGVFTGADVIDQVAQAGGIVVGRTQAYHWVTPVALGESLSIQFTVPAQVGANGLSFGVEWVSHLTVSPLAERLQPQGASLSCEKDIACGSAAEQTTGKSVARMVYTDPSTGSTYTCTGTLMNNSKADGAPYFLTANHCISTQAVASTLQTYWFYQAAVCGVDTPSGNLVSMSGGGALLYTSADTDTTLLRLNQSAPANATFAAWYSGQVGLSNTVFGIHHPHGDLKKITSGVNATYATCVDTAGSTSDFSCTTGADVSVAKFHVVGYTEGTTEGGSSGSALFLNQGGSHYVVGQLKGGNGECTTSTTTGFGIYGRFDTAFNAGMSQWLSPATTSSTRTAVYRFYNTATGTHFFTGSATEKDSVIANLPTYKYEGVAFYTYAKASTGTSPVYRFYNTLSGTHFYTISEAEKANVVANLSSYKLEGPAWHAATVADGTNIPLYRFYNLTTGTHFYTTSAAEKDNIVANLSNYQYEGVAYNVWKTQ